VPNIASRNLPMITGVNGSDSNSNNFQEREILYKLLFEMKSDLNSLKTLISELIRNNDLSVSDTQSLRALQIPNLPAQNLPSKDYQRPLREMISEEAASHFDNEKPILIENGTSDYENMEIVDENLRLDENEKDLIRKALRKHTGKRKEAAQDLGISERTLYRKIKEYDLQ
jgi:DNA-binding NtrC family response regulator